MLAKNVQYIRLAFREKYRMTIFQYLKIVRLEEAKNALLLSPELSL